MKKLSAMNVLAALACGAITFWSARPVAAQNVSGYDSIPNPYLLLLREPAVHQDLKLKGKQQQELLALNREQDGTLLALRNWPAAKSDARFSELVAETRRRLDTILDRNQIERISQIMLRLKGTECVLLPTVSERLKLTAEQKQTIQRVADEARTRLEKLRNQGSEAAAEAKTVIEDRHRQILGELTAPQKKDLAALLGERFDPSQLGRVSFKAPELTGSGEWINTQPLQLAALKGQVVVLHFWTFG